MFLTGVKYYVSTSGNDSHAGTSPSTAVLTITHAASLANSAGPGTLVIVGPGTFAAGATQFNPGTGVSWQGSGTLSTTITSTLNSGAASFGANICYRPTSNTFHKDMTIKGTGTAGNFQFLFGFSDSVGFTNVLAERINLVGDSDGFYLNPTTSTPFNASLFTRDCTANSAFDGFNCFNTTGSIGTIFPVYSEHHNLNVNVVGPGTTGGTIARGITGQCGSHFINGGSISVSGHVTSDTSGVEAASTAAFVLNGTAITTSSTGGSTVKDLNQGTGAAGSGGSITAFGMPTTKTAGIISVVPPLGANVGTALAIGVGTVGAVVVNGGDLGGPTSGDLSSCTNYPTSALVNSADTQTGTSYALVLTDAGKLVTLSNASAITLTIPASSTVAWIANTRIDLLQLGAGQVTFSTASGVTLNSSGGLTKSAGQYAGQSLLYVATNTWVLVGARG